MNNRRQIAEEFAKNINCDEIKQIILFGSVARGEDTVDSDIDILIVSDNRDEIWDSIADEIAWFMYDKQELISAHVVNEERFNNSTQEYFLSNVVRDGVSIG